MVPKVTSVVLRHHPDVPPLAQGHAAVATTQQRETTILAVDTWLRHPGPGRLRLDAKEAWFRPLEPDEVARLRYIRSNDFNQEGFAEQAVPFDNAWKRLQNLLRSVQLPGTAVDITNLWACRTADEVVQVLRLDLRPPMLEELERCWTELLTAHAALLTRYMAVLEET